MQEILRNKATIKSGNEKNQKRKQRKMRQKEGEWKQIAYQIVGQKTFRREDMKRLSKKRE